MASVLSVPENPLLLVQFGRTHLMDATLQRYRRRMASGDGNWRELIDLAARGGISRGDVLYELVDQSLHPLIRRKVKFHLSQEPTADFDTLGAGQVEAVVEAVRVLFAAGLAKDCLVLAPAGLLPSYMEYFKGRPGIHGPKNAFQDSELVRLRQQLYPTPSGKVYFCSYTALARTVTLRKGPHLSHHNWDICIAAESHMIRDPASRRSQVTYTLGRSSKKRMALTPSPTPSSGIVGLWGIFKFLKPDLYRTPNEFMQRYCITVQTGNRIITNRLKDGAADQLKEDLKGRIGVWWRH